MNNVPPDFFKFFMLCTGSAFAGVAAVLGVALALQKLFFDKFVTRDELRNSLLESESKIVKLIADDRHAIRNDINAMNLLWTERFDKLTLAMAGVGSQLQRVLGRLEGETKDGKE